VNDDGLTANGHRRQPSIQQRATEQLRALAEPHRFRVAFDAEGFPVISGHYGQIEWFDGTDLAVYTDRPRLFARLWAVPGVRRHQTGDMEMRAVFATVASSRSPERSRRDAGGRSRPRKPVGADSSPHTERHPAGRRPDRC